MCETNIVLHIILPTLYETLKCKVIKFNILQFIPTNESAEIQVCVQYGKRSIVQITVIKINRQPFKKMFLP